MAARTAARLAFSKAAVVQGQLLPLRNLSLSSSPSSSIATATSALLPHLSPSSQSPVAAPPRQIASLHPLRHFSSSFGTSYARPSTALAAHYSGLVNIQARLGSSAASLPVQQPGPAQPPASSHDTPKDVSQSKETEISQYWGIVPKKPGRVDGTAWPWACFQPSDTYSADLSIDVSKHHQAEKMVDKLAQGVVNFLRIPVDLLFRNRHVSHALLLETVAAVPGMVGGMLLHCRSLRRFEHSGGWIKALLDEAENERMHLMTWTEVMKPNWLERALVLGVQGGFFNAYFLLYLASPRLAHRLVGYLEEEAVKSYTEFLEAIDKKEMPNAPAPLIAIDYWRLPKDATVRDVVLVIRADEAHHRDVNHFAADIHGEGKQLREFPAPIGYH